MFKECLFNRYTNIAVFSFLIFVCLFASCHRSKQPKQEINKPAVVSVPTPPLPQLIRDKSKIRYGETLSTILRKNGIDHTISYAISQEFKSVYNLRQGITSSFVPHSS